MQECFDLCHAQSFHPIPDPDEYTKTLGVQWNSGIDHFRLTVVEFPKTENLTKRLLVSDIARTFDVLGWFSPFDHQGQDSTTTYMGAQDRMG